MKLRQFELLVLFAFCVTYCGSVRRPRFPSVETRNGWSQCGLDFPCRDGQDCIRNQYLCDGESDCNDGSDESPEMCKDDCLGLPNRFKCGNDRCIKDANQCDGENDCSDGTDETSELCADCAGLKAYTTSLFKCTKSSRCIEKSFICDSVSDCGQDSSDEDSLLCNDDCGGFADRFQCENKKCIYRDQICDGRADCVDGSDERNCTSYKTKLNAGFL